MSKYGLVLEFSAYLSAHLAPILAYFSAYSEAF